MTTDQERIESLQTQLHRMTVETGIYLQALRDVLDAKSSDDLVCWTGMSRAEADVLITLASDGATAEQVDAEVAQMKQRLEARKEHKG